MKKSFAILILMLFGFGMVSEARVVYDKTGRKIIVDDTIRGRKRAMEIQKERQIKMEAAAAAKLDYEQALKSLDEPKHKYKRKEIY